MGILNYLSDIFKPKSKEIRYNISQQSVRDNPIIKGQQNQIAELQAILGRLQTEKAERKELDSQKETEENVKQYLQEDKKRLIQENQEKFFSLKAFFQRYLKDEKFRNSLYITSFDRSENLGRFGDFGFSGNSFVILNDKNQKILGTREIKDLFQSVSALSNDISSNKIPINLDKEGDWIENLMEWEAPEIIREGDKIRYSKVRKKPLYELLKEKDAQIQMRNIELMELETICSKQQDKMDDLERAHKMEEKSGEVSRSERVNMAEKLSNVEKIFLKTENELTQLRNIFAVQEDEISSLEEMLTNLKEKVEGEAVKSSIDKALEMVLHIKSSIVRDMPETVSQEKDGSK